MTVTAASPAGDLQDEAARIEGKRFLPRALAYLIDSAVLFAIDFAAGLVIGVALGVLLFVLGAVFRFELAFANRSNFLLDVLVGLLQMLVYFAVFEAAYGASPAKLLLGMRVISLDGKIPTIGQAFQRSIWRLADGLFFGLVAHAAMEPPLMQRNGDKRAKTVVVAARSPAVLQKPSAWRLLLAFGAYSLFSALTQILQFIPAVTITPMR